MTEYRSHYFILLLLLLATTIMSGCSNSPQTLHGSPYDPPRAAPELPLQTTDGDDFNLASLRGDIALIYFGYTYCPDICPTTLADVKLIFEELEDVSDDLHLIMVTVDPERDTPEVLDTYLNRFHPGFLGLYGEGEQLNSVLADYAVFAQKDPSDDPDRYLVSHTARLFLIDPNGMLRSNYAFGTPREEILTDVQLLMAEEARR